MSKLLFIRRLLCRESVSSSGFCSLPVHPPSTQPPTYLPLLRRQQTRVRDFEKKNMHLFYTDTMIHAARAYYIGRKHRRTGARCRDFAQGDTGSPLLGQSLPPHTYRIQTARPTMTPLTRPGGGHTSATREHYFYRL